MKYYVSYYTKDGDYSKVWVNADSASEAESEVRSEYWDVDEIISITEA